MMPITFVDPNSRVRPVPKWVTLGTLQAASKWVTLGTLQAAGQKRSPRSVSSSEGAK